MLNLKKKLFYILVAIIIWLLFLPLKGHAQSAPDGTSSKNDRHMVVYARLKNHLTHEDADSALSARLLLASDSSLVANADIYSNVWDGERYTTVNALITSSGRYLFHITGEGYLEKYVPFTIAKLYKHEQGRELKPVYLHRRPKPLEYNLDEVVVKATKLKFCMHGDTLVYNADAFNLAEGSMIDALIRKLPGVELHKGGEIMVNGQRVDALLLNGNDLFDSDRELMLENLPAYMVKTVQSYERVPEMVRGSNNEKNAKRELVMNIRLKPDYHVGWVSSAQVGAGGSFHEIDDTKRETKFLSRLFALHYSDKSRLSFFANANNLNDSRTPGDNGDWTPLSQSQGLASVYKVGADYSIGKWDHLRYHGSAHTTYQEKDESTRASSQLFLAGNDSYTRAFRSKRSYDLSLYSNHDFTFRSQASTNWYKRLSFSLRPEFYYLRYNNRIGAASASFNDDVALQFGKSLLDSLSSPDASVLLRKYAVNRVRSQRRASGHCFNTEGTLFLSYTPAHNDRIDFSANGYYKITDNSDKDFEDYRLDYPSSSTLKSDNRNRYNLTKDNSVLLTFLPRVSYMLTKPRKIIQSLEVTTVFNYSRNRTNKSIYLLNLLDGWNRPLGQLPSAALLAEALDNDNSSRCLWTNTSFSPSLTYSFSHSTIEGYTMLNASLSFSFMRDRLDYWQGIQADTLLHRHKSFIEPSITFIHELTKRGRRIDASYSLQHAPAPMTMLVNVNNTSNPLYITRTNANLKTSVFHTFSTSYKDKFGRGTLFNTDIRLTVNDNAVAQGYVYYKSSGVRIITPENVRGNWNGSMRTGVDFALDKAQKWRLKENATYEYLHSVDMNAVSDGTWSVVHAERSVVSSNYLRNTLALSFRLTDKMEFSANTGLNYQHSTSAREGFSTINVCDFNYGLTARVELPWSMQASTDLTMYSRRGYSDVFMNTNELVWNARLTKRIMKGNLLLQFDAFDLLGKLSNVRRTIDGQGRTETFYNMTPSYGIFHLTWRINKKPKK